MSASAEAIRLKRARTSRKPKEGTLPELINSQIGPGDIAGLESPISALVNGRDALLLQDTPAVGINPLSQQVNQAHSDIEERQGNLSPLERSVNNRKSGRRSR